jgi:hypothetical protein
MDEIVGHDKYRINTLSDFEIITPKGDNEEK